MIEQLTPSYKFTCDRCGKAILADEIEYNEVKFVYSVFSNAKTGQVCKDCYNDFKELADNFFDEANKEADDDEI